MTTRILRFTLAALLVLAALLMAALASTYLAGHAYYLLHRTMPRQIHLDTWYRYWQVWSDYPAERRRLAAAAIIGAALVLMPPLWLVIELSRRPSALHGDARWATTTEIREAGLL